MGFLGKIFTWWEGATIGTILWSARNGEHVGTDAQGNKYYRSKNKRDDLPTADSPSNTSLNCDTLPAPGAAAAPPR